MIETINDLFLSVVAFLKLPIVIGGYDFSLWSILLVVIGIDLIVIVITKILDL